MGTGKVVGIIAGLLAVVAFAFVISLLLIKVIWAWTVPDLFPKAVEQGLVARDISWLTAIKLALFIAILSGCAKGARVNYKRGGVEVHAGPGSE
jgi:hypothetical protein